jgi:hypothetical protein
VLRLVERLQRSRPDIPNRIERQLIFRDRLIVRSIENVNEVVGAEGHEDLLTYDPELLHHFPGLRLALRDVLDAPDALISQINQQNLGQSALLEAGKKRLANGRVHAEAIRGHASLQSCSRN